MTKTAEFGTYGNKTTRTGIVRQSFQPIMKLHFSVVNQTITQKYETIGSIYQDSRIIAVNHNNNLSDDLVCKIDSQVYKILSISPGHDIYVSYDLITLSAIKNKKG